MEEIEVLEAIFGDDIFIDIITTGKCIIKKKCIPRVDVVHVEAFIEIICENNIISSIQFKHIKGVTDVAELEKQIQVYIHMNVVENDENITIFQIIENITEYMEIINIPECLICCESVNMNTNNFNNSKRQLEFVKTSCNHIYHFECICKWACITYKNQLNSKESLHINNNNKIAMKSLNGSITSLKQEFLNLNNINILNNTNIEILINKIEILNKILIDIKLLPKPKFKNNIEIDLNINLHIETYDELYITDIIAMNHKCIKYNELLNKIKQNNIDM